MALLVKAQYLYTLDGYLTKVGTARTVYVLLAVVGSHCDAHGRKDDRGGRWAVSRYNRGTWLTPSRILVGLDVASSVSPT